jgi:hypothetical protein
MVPAAGSMRDWTPSGYRAVQAGTTVSFTAMSLFFVEQRTVNLV